MCAALFLVAAAAAQTNTIVVFPASASSTVLATATTYSCSMQSNAAKTIVTISCSKSGTAMGATTLNVSQPSEVVTWQVNGGANDVINGTYTQAATVGTITYSVNVNGGTPVTGNF